MHKLNVQNTAHMELFPQLTHSLKFSLFIQAAAGAGRSRSQNNEDLVWVKVKIKAFRLGSNETLVRDGQPWSFEGLRA